MTTSTAPADIPVTVVGGYLGSGKTTRINAVLRQPQGLRLAVVVNDFGAVNVDAELMRRNAGDLFQLANGCVCCSLSDDMTTVMDQLSQLRPAPDHVVIEVSGVGDPAAVAQWGTLPGFSTGGVVVCVDAETIEQRAADRWVADTVRHQLDGADVFLLSKRDLVSDQHRRRVRGWLASIAPGVPVLDSPDALTTLLRDPLVDVGKAVTTAPGHHDSHRSWGWTCGSPVDADAVLARLRALPDTVVRAKGVLRSVSAPDRRTVVQSVGRRCEVSDDGPWRDGDESTLVLIATPDLSVEPELGALGELFGD